MGYVKCEVSIYRLRRNREEQHRSPDELQRTAKNKETLMDLERKEERTYCGRGSSGGVLRNSGTNRLMQRPTVRQRRGLTMEVALRCGDVARKKNG